MKLTNYVRDAFVSSVMADVPCVNYQEQVEKIVRDDAYRQMPAEIKAIHDNKNFKHYLFQKYIGLYRTNFGSMTVCAPDDYVIGEEALKKISELDELSKAQSQKRRDLENSLHGAIYSVTTVKNARELLVDFADYLPDETKPTKQLPAISGLTEAFKAAGFPKDKEA